MITQQQAPKEEHHDTTTVVKYEHKDGNKSLGTNPRQNQDSLVGKGKKK